MRFTWDERRDKVLRDVWGKIPIKNICERLGCGHSTVEKRARALNLPLQKPPTRRLTL